MAKIYGDRPPWHDVQIAITGPAVADVETVFRERWDDPQPLSRSPLRLIADRMHADDLSRAPLPAQLAPPAATGTHAVQLLRTYGRRLGGYPFAPQGERSVARGYRKSLARARRLIYLEDQYLWSATIGKAIAQVLRSQPTLQLIAVLPLHPDQDGKVSLPPNLIGRHAALSVIRAAAPDRVAVYGIENRAGTPVYVHAKVCIIDDLWASVGSDNFNRRSWTHDSELAAAVLDTASERSDEGTYAWQLRMALAREHLDDSAADGDSAAMFAMYARTAAALQQWYDGGQAGPRPPGRLRPIHDVPQPWSTRIWAEPLYRTVYDPDGRPVPMRLRGQF
jgi:phosphatidylserine/phosphatidylglycerophosphate/cardiolipin synthase-like enzyme